MRTFEIKDERTNWTYVTTLLLHSVEWQSWVYTQHLTDMGAQPMFELGTA
jgi:hypothetical protein